MLAVLSTLVGLVTYALWSGQATTDAIVTSGNFSLTLGDLSWSCSAQCVTSEDLDLENFVIAPGQTLVMSQEIIGTFKGNNLEVELSLSFSDLPNNMTGSWHVEDAGEQVAPSSGDVALSEALILPQAAKNTVKTWVIVLSLSMASGTDIWVNPLDALPPDPTLDSSLELGTLTIFAQQIRCGNGFITSPCGNETTEAPHGS